MRYDELLGIQTEESLPDDLLNEICKPVSPCMALEAEVYPALKAYYHAQQ